MKTRSGGAGALFEVDPLDSGKTRVVFHMHFVAKFGPLGWLMDVMMVRKQFEQVVGEILEGLEACLKTSAVIGCDGQPGRAAA